MFPILGPHLSVPAPAALAGGLDWAGSQPPDSEDMSMFTALLDPGKAQVACQVREDRRPA